VYTSRENTRIVAGRKCRRPRRFGLLAMVALRRPWFRALLLTQLASLWPRGPRVSHPGATIYSSRGSARVRRRRVLSLGSLGARFGVSPVIMPAPSAAVVARFHRIVADPRGRFVQPSFAAADLYMLSLRGAGLVVAVMAQRYRFPRSGRFRSVFSSGVAAGRRGRRSW